MSRPLIIISRNPASYLSGHSIFAWQLSEFLGGRAQVPVVHITHTTDEGPRHSVDITPPVSTPLYRRIEVEYEAMEKVPHSLSSCSVADAVDAVLQENPEGVCGVLAISPLSYLADVVNVCLPSRTPVVSLLRGTDTLVLKQLWGSTAAGQRYRRALDACNGIYTVSHWLLDLAVELDIPVTGVVAPVTFHPFASETFDADAEELIKGLFPRSNNAGQKLVIFAGRMAAEKGALKVANVIDKLLNLDSSFPRRHGRLRSRAIEGRAGPCGPHLERSLLGGRTYLPQGAGTGHKDRSDGDGFWFGRGNELH